MLRFLAISAALAAGMAVSAPLSAATKFDGRWSVSIVTERGDCDRGYRYEIHVTNGRVSNAGVDSFDVSGAVAANGKVSVTVAKGSQSATGTGQLSARSGGGIWRGRASSGECAGRWEAERL